MSSKKPMMCAFWEGEWGLPWCRKRWEEGGVSSSEPEVPKQRPELSEVAPCGSAGLGAGLIRWGQGLSHYTGFL